MLQKVEKLQFKQFCVEAQKRAWEARACVCGYVCECV